MNFAKRALAVFLASLLLLPLGAVSRAEVDDGPQVIESGDHGAGPRRAVGNCEPTEHHWREWEIVSMPTETEEGLMRRECRLDPSHIETAAIPAGEFGAHEMLRGYCGGEGDGKNLIWSLSDSNVLTVTGTGRMADYGSYWLLDEDHNVRYDLPETNVSTTTAPWNQNIVYEEQLFDLLGLNISDETGFIMAIANGDVTFERYQQIIESLEYNDPHTVSVGEGVTYIGANAFGFWNVSSVSLPSTLEEIGYSAFASLTAAFVTLPAGLRFIDPLAFQENRFENIVIPASVEKIGQMAFVSNYYGYNDPHTLTNITVMDPNADIGSIFGGLSVLSVYGRAFPLQTREDSEDYRRFDALLVDYYFLRSIDPMDESDSLMLQQLGCTDEQIARYAAFVEASLVCDAQTDFGFEAQTREDMIEGICAAVCGILGADLTEEELFEIHEESPSNTSAYSRGELLLAPAAEAAFEARFGIDFPTMLGIQFEPREISAILSDASFSPAPWVTVCGPCTAAWAEAVEDAMRFEGTGHDLTNSAVLSEPSCTEPGKIAYLCSICGRSVFEYIPALGHLRGETVKENVTAPGCVTDGGWDNVVCCERCGDEIIREHTTAPGDAYGSKGYDVSSAPSTCTVRGYKMTVCIACGEITAYQEYEIDPDNHRWGEWEVVKQATYEDEGLMRRVCQNDASHVEERVIPRYEEDDNGEPSNVIREFIEKIESYTRGIIDWILRLFNFFGH